MNTSTLQKVQATLEQRGVLDVKFLFKREAHSALGSDLLADVVDVMNKYLHADTAPVSLGNFEDEVRPAAF
jgi:hypothetical protein